MAYGLRIECYVYAFTDSGLMLSRGVELKIIQQAGSVIAIVNVINVCYCGMLLRRRARNLMIHVVHLKVNFHRLKISVFDLDRAVCKILNSGSPWVIASHKGWTIHPGRTTNL